MITPAYAKARAFLGSTPEEIQQKFAAIQEMNFAQGNAKLIISRLSDKELASIAYYYNQSAPAGENGLLRIIAQKADAGSLVRVAKAFGSAATQQAVKNFAPASVQQDFSREMAMNPGISSRAATAAEATVPMASASTEAQSLADGEQAMDHIYLDYRTAPVGNTSVQAGLMEAGMYASLGATSLGWWIGHDVLGPVANYEVQKNDPSLYNDIGGTIDSAIQNIANAGTELQQGQYENAWDSVFGSPLGLLGDFSGDWNVGASYQDYEQSGGGGGC